MDPLSLFLAIVWGAIGFGYFIYGRKRQKLIPMIGGILIMGSSYAFKTPLSLSIASVILVAGIYVLNKRF